MGSGRGEMEVEVEHFADDTSKTILYFLPTPCHPTTPSPLTVL